MFPMSDDYDIDGWLEAAYEDRYDSYLTGGAWDDPYEDNAAAAYEEYRFETGGYDRDYAEEAYSYWADFDSEEG